MPSGSRSRGNATSWTSPRARSTWGSNAPPVGPPSSSRPSSAGRSWEAARARPIATTMAVGRRASRPRSVSSGASWSTSTSAQPHAGSGSTRTLTAATTIPNGIASTSASFPRTGSWTTRLDCPCAGRWARSRTTRSIPGSAASRRPPRRRSGSPPIGRSSPAAPGWTTSARSPARSTRSARASTSPAASSPIDRSPAGVYAGDMAGFDVAVVGGGPAGLAAALAVGRMNRRAIVFEAGVPRASHAPCYHNVLGFPDGIPGERLMALGREHAGRWGAKFREAAVAEIRRTSRRGRERFEVVLADGSRASASGIVLATGVKDRQPGCGPLYDETPRGVHYCAICDGRETVGERTAVVGRDSHAVGMVDALRDFTTDLHLLLDAEADVLDVDSARALDAWGVEVVPGLLETADCEPGAIRL